MPDMKVPLLKGDRIAPDVQYRSNLPVNMYAVLNPIFGVSGFMAAHPGYTPFNSDPVQGGDRGGVWNERLVKHFRVDGSQLIIVDASGRIEEVGFIDGADGFNFQAALPYSFQSQLIVTGKKAYRYNNGVLTLMVDSGGSVWGEPIDACWVDGYYFLTDGETLYHTDLNDETMIDPLQFATAEFSPDPTKGVAKTQDNQVIVFNRYTTEFFRNAASTEFAFTRTQGKAVKAGIIGTHLKIEVGGFFYCLGSRKEEAPTFIVISAGSADNFSNREIDKLLSTYTEAELSIGVMTTRVDDRETLIYVQLPYHTLLFNATVAASDGPDNAWSILRYQTAEEPWEYLNPVFDPRISSWIGGNRRGIPILNKLNDNSASQAGEKAEMILYTPFLKLEQASVDRIEIEVIPGQQIEEVKAFISITYDGVTYGREWSLGYSQGLGDYSRRFIARRLGYCRDWMGFRIRLVTESKVAFSDMVLTYG
jgi:hypothetical protein